MNITTENQIDERAICVEEAVIKQRARTPKETIQAERANNVKKTIPCKRPTFEDVLTVRLLVRAREDFQSMRKKTDNRAGRKADGTEQNIEERSINAEDLAMFIDISDNCREQEKSAKKNLKERLKRFPVYTEYLLNVKGVGDIAAGHIIGNINIHEATTVSKIWQYCGLNPGMVRGKKRVEDKKGNVTFETTDTMIRGDKLTAGFVSPFNKNLRTALVGVLADGFIKQQNFYCMEFYYPYKARLEQEENEVLHRKSKGKPEELYKWKEVSKRHRDRAAKRYMIKMFLKDLYVAWRELEGLPVRAPYQEEYLGHKH